MSIIIRLQSLPLTAKSADIRRFFAGLRIPNGGVHIVGGESGDAFIAFTSDEDARLAMRKDGGKIMDSRIKLYLSSHMEMQHEIECITKEPAISHRRLSNERQRFSRSPLRADNREGEANMFFNDKNYRNSPGRGRNGKGYSPPRSRRSRSPRMRSRSPKRRSRSPRRRSRSPRGSYRRSRSPVARRSSPHPRPMSPFGNNLSRSQFLPGDQRDRLTFRDENSKDYFGSEQEAREDSSRKRRGLNLQEEQALLERKIAEALSTGFESMEKMNDMYRNSPSMPSTALGSDVPYNFHPQAMPFQHTAPFQENIIQDRNVLPVNNWRPLSTNNFGNESINVPMNFGPGVPNMPPPMHGQPMVHMSNLPPMPGPPPPMSGMPPSFPMAPIVPPPNMPAMPPSVGMAPMPMTGDLPFVDTAVPGFYITMSGLDPAWHIGDVQKMLKGAFVAERNIKWEIDDRGFKTGTAFIKLCNKEDFMQLLSCPTYSYNNRLITVSECPDHVFQRYFLPDWSANPNVKSPRGNFYYKMKGIPYIVTDEEVLAFFNGLEVTDLYVVYEKSGKATGIGWVAFGNSEDYQLAARKSGAKLGHRFIHMMASSKKKMFEAKRRNGDLLSASKDFVPANVTNKSLQVPSAKRSLCALLTGLPPNISSKKIVDFFGASGVQPDAIHITLTNNNHPTGRAFTEFYNFRDFDSALECHGNSIDGGIICVKQILYEEMIKILDTTKAEHSYKDMLESCVLNEPEKVPYLWHPPDILQERSVQLPKMMAPTEEPFRPKKFEFRRPSRNFQESKRPSKNFQDFKRSSKKFPEFKRPSANIQVFEYENRSRNFEQKIPQELDHQLSHKPAQNKEWYPKEVPISMNPQMDIDNEVQFLGIHEKEDINRLPVKFEVKIKPAVTKNTKVDNAFDKTMSEEKKKLSKLSPERSLVKAPQVTSNSNKAPEKAKNKNTSDVPKDKLKSPERNTKKRDRRSPERTSKHPASRTEQRNDRVKNEPREDRSKNEPREDRSKNEPREDRFKNESRDDRFKNEPREDRFKNEPREDRSRNEQRADRFRNEPREDRFRNEPREDRFKNESKENRSRNEQRDSRLKAEPKSDRFKSDLREDNFKAEPREDRYKRYRDRTDNFLDRHRSPPGAEAHLYPEIERKGEVYGMEPFPFDRMHDAYEEEATVQISNVDPILGSRELEHFLGDYNIDVNKIIRRFTDIGEPTGDIRVSFRNYREAARALRDLNGVLLNGIPIEMFIIN